MNASRPYQRWVVALSDPAGPAETRPEGQLTIEDLPAVARVADAHSVLPAVLANLNRIDPDLGKEARREMTDALAPARYRLTRRTVVSMLLRQQRVDIEAAMRRRGLPMTVIKGPAFADRLYDRPGLRPFTDLDILVPREAFCETEQVLAELGYRRAEAENRKHADRYGQQSWSPPPSPTAGGAVEIHWNLVNSPRLREGVSVQYRDLVTDGSVTPAALLLIAAVHGATSHSFDRLGLLWDIAQAVREQAGPLDEAWLTDTVARTGAVRAMAAGLRLVRTVLGVAAAGDLAGRLKLPTGPLDRVLLTRATVWGERFALAKARQKGFRQLLKRP